jgi:DNA-directed RNA polymerase subunit RPC12/RpoP
MPRCGCAGQEPGPALAEVLRLGLAAAAPKLPTPHWKILRALLACRTPAMGGHRYLCQECGRTHFAPHSCRNRHCPICQGAAAHRWLQQQQSALLPVPYFHLVFTLPHVLNPLIRQNQKALYALLFEAASQTVLQFGQARFGGQLGITAVLHTWSQTLLDHYHLHCIVTGGALAGDGTRWVRASPRYLFAVKALSVVFRARFCAGLEQLQARGKLHFHGQLRAVAAPAAFARLLRQAARKRWVVYSKRPFGGPEQVLAYLSRYTHRVAISPRRLVSLHRQARTVTFGWKDYADGCRRKTMTLPAGEFLRRFCLHLLPARFVKIRHFGFLSNRQRQTRLAQARGLLKPATPSDSGAKEPTAVTPEAPPGIVCPHCGSQRLRLVQIVPAGSSTLRAPAFDSS